VFAAIDSLSNPLRPRHAAPVITLGYYMYALALRAGHLQFCSMCFSDAVQLKAALPVCENLSQHFLCVFPHKNGK
jgi:hypothetical protein